MSEVGFHPIADRPFFGRVMRIDFREHKLSNSDLIPASPPTVKRRFRSSYSRERSHTGGCPPRWISGLHPLPQTGFESYPVIEIILKDDDVKAESFNLPGVD